MFDSLEDLSSKLAATGYFIDPVMTKVVFLAAKLQIPITLEGPAGSGKTQLAVSVAQAAGTHIERLQCYEGITDKQAIGEFDQGLQRLYMEFSKEQGLSWQEIVRTLKGRDFFRPGPIMRALECEHPCVLLIDELDKVPEAVEAMLLEPLSVFQLSIPEFGTVPAKTIPFVVITSNGERRLGEADKRDQDMLTSNVADLVPVEMPWSGTRRSPLILFETPYRQLIPFSMFDPDLSDANGLLMAKSGGGKTLAAQQMLLMAARANPLISILERGDSYQPLVELMGGEMIEMSLDSEQTINPWDLPRGEAKPSNDQISFLKNLTRHMLGENTPPDLDIDLLDSVLLEAIASTYKRCSAKTSNPVPLFGDLAAELAHWQDRDRNQKINAMAQMASTKLRAWVDEGPYARLFDRPTTVQLSNPWLYFNVEKLKDDPRLERAMSLLIAHTATYRASGFTGQPSIVLLDECWALLESPILASVVVQLFRTARKRNASVWGISQTPEDFVGTPDRPNEHGAGIVKNATTKIIGKQPGDMTALRDHVHLNETALNQIKTFAHPKKGHSAEFLIAVGEKAESTHAIRIVPSAVDYWITTTYPRERIFRKWWLQQNHRLPKLEAYERLAKQYPRGLAEVAQLPEELSGQVQEVLTQ
jgi:hypothetical protein